MSFPASLFHQEDLFPESLQLPVGRQRARRLTKAEYAAMTADERKEYKRVLRLAQPSEQPSQWKVRRQKHRAKSKVTNRAWRKANRDKMRQARRRYNLKHPGKSRGYSIKANFKHHYGLTVEEYDRLLIAQGGKCAICDCSQSENDRGYRLHVDHDHGTGKLRGLLCNRCNSSLGYMKDDPALLRRAADYVEAAR